MDPKGKLISSFFCVPDITGFTRLMANADIDFTQEIIPSLLRKLIDTNILKMTVAEIEGDAIFFYRTGRLPNVSQVVKQCKLFYKVFKEYILSLKDSHPESYSKHLIGGQLGLKVIIHYGKISTTNIKGRTKLIGQDVIVVHKLLKNNVREDEYILLSENYLKKINNYDPSNFFDWAKLKDGSETYEFIGEVKYKYIRLTPKTCL